MADHDGQRLSGREMVRVHLYPALAVLGTAGLLFVSLQLIPIAQQARYVNECIEAMRSGTVKTSVKSRSVAPVRACVSYSSNE